MNHPRAHCGCDALCRVSPHPALLKKMQAELKSLRARGTAIAPGLLRLRRSKPVGMDDGTIFPGDSFPLGTSAETVRRAALQRAPLTGAVRVIVVLVDFSDKKMTRPKSQFEELFFSVGTLPTGSVRDYFREVSNGKVDIVGEVVGPFQMPKTLAEYAHGESGTGTAEPNARTMARAAAEAANPGVNFAPYDNDGNGYVDAFIIVHAGKGAEETGSVGDIWSHKWVLAGSPYAADTKKIYAYLTVPEDSRIGVCCHELGHLLFGWPDLYDTDYSSEGIGNWCLMAGGSWNGNGDTPAHPSAWCKATQNWITVVTPSANTTVDIADVKTGYTAYKLWKNGAPAKEYFLVENRQQTRFDALLPGAGLLVYHIDDAIGDNSDEAHPKVALEQADGRKHLESGANRGDAGDPFPGTSNKTRFNRTSKPNSRSYGGLDTKVAVTEIGASGATMSVKLAVR